MITFIICALILFFLYTKRDTNAIWYQKHALSLGFTIKMFGSLTFFLVYSYYHKTGTLYSDASTFMEEAKIMNHVFYQNPIDYFKFLFGLENEQLIHQYLSETDHWSAGSLTLLNDAQNVVRANGLFYFISQGEIFIHFAIFNLIFILSLHYFVNSVKERFSWNPYLLYFSILLFPSSWFWSSSILKEPLMLSGLFLVLGSFFSDKFLKKNILFGLFGILLMLGFKTYIFIFLFPFVLLSLFVNTKKLKIYYFLFIFFGALNLFFVIENPASKKTLHYLSNKQYDFKNVARGGLIVFNGKKLIYIEKKWYSKMIIHQDSVQFPYTVYGEILNYSNDFKYNKIKIPGKNQRWLNFYSTEPSGSYIEITGINNSTEKLFQVLPEALINAIIRPTPWDAGGKMKWFNFLEVLIFYPIIAYNFIKNYRKNVQNRKNIQLALVTSALLIFLLIGCITPVFGAIVRYRVPAMILLLITSYIGSNIKKTNE